jgi:hypothetical protein
VKRRRIKIKIKWERRGRVREVNKQIKNMEEGEVERERSSIKK